MPKVLDAGTETLSNADVLEWIKSKRAQHAKEDADDKKAGRCKVHRPSNFVSALRKHERELVDVKYPYVANPGAYEGENRDRSLELFLERCDQDICFPLEEKYKGGKGLTLKQIQKRLGKEQDKKCFTPSELLMIHNIAPENVSMLETMIDGWQDRFTSEEMEKVVAVVQEVFRCGDRLPTVDSTMQET